MLDALALLHAELLHDALDLVSAEETDQVVLQRDVEAAFARVSLASRTSAQLVVDAARFVAFGADYAQAACCDDFFMLFGADGFELLQHLFILFVIFLRVKPLFAHFLARKVLGVAAQHNVGAAAGHVGGHRDGAEAACLRHDQGFLVVHLGV